jgi:hypothetical protein
MNQDHFVVEEIRIRGSTGAFTFLIKDRKIVRTNYLTQKPLDLALGERAMSFALQVGSAGDWLD